MGAPSQINRPLSKQRKKALRGCRSIKTLKKKHSTMKRRLRNLDWNNYLLPKMGEDDEMAGPAPKQSTLKRKGKREPSSKRKRKIMKARMRAEKESTRMTVDSAPPRKKKTKKKAEKRESDDSYEDVEMNEGEDA